METMERSGTWHHGTVAGYSKHGCRCVLCRGSMRRYRRVQRQRIWMRPARVITTPVPPDRFLRVLNGVLVPCRRCDLPLEVDQVALAETRHDVQRRAQVADMLGPVPGHYFCLVLRCLLGHEEIWRGGRVPRTVSGAKLARTGQGLLEAPA